MATRSKALIRSIRSSRLIKAIREHPVATAGIAGAAVAGAVLIRRGRTGASKGGATKGDATNRKTPSASLRARPSRGPRAAKS